MKMMGREFSENDLIDFFNYLDAGDRWYPSEDVKILVHQSAWLEIREFRGTEIESLPDGFTRMVYVYKDKRLPIVTNKYLMEDQIVVYGAM